MADSHNPPYLADREVVVAVHESLRELAQRELRTRIEQAAHAKADGDRLVFDSRTTYAVRYADFAAQRERIEREYESLLPAVRKLVEQA